MFRRVNLAAQVKDVPIKAKIKPPKIHNSIVLQNQTPKNISAYWASHSKFHAYAISSGRYSDTDPITARHEWKDRSKWHERKEPLWWAVACKKELAVQKKTIRTWLTRRFRNAFVESLAKKGYSSDGSRLTDHGQQLYGTLQFMAHAISKDLKYAELVKETDLMVIRLENIANSRKNSRSVGRSTNLDHGKRGRN